MNSERLNIIESRKLLKGTHTSIEDGGCVMEMVSYLANEPWSDHPKCACPVLTEFAIRINDRFNDEHRQLLKPFIPMLVNTKSTDAVEIARKRVFRWRHATVIYPEILDTLKLTELATQLRGYGNNLDDMATAAKVLGENRDLIEKTSHTYAYADAYAYAYAHSDAYAYTNAYANANAYADADVVVYADEYALTDAYADDWRAKIAQISLETLRMGIEATK